MDKIDAEIARMEVEFALEDEGKQKGSVGLTTVWKIPSFASLNPFGVAPVTAEIVVNEKDTFFENVLSPAIEKLGKGPIGPGIVDQSELNTTFSVPSNDQPQAMWSLEIPQVARKIYILLYVNSGGVSYTVAKPTAASGKSSLPTGRSTPYRLSSSQKGAKKDFRVQSSLLTTVIEIAISK